MSLLTAKQLAGELSMHPITVLKWAREGRIPAELKIGRSPRFDADQVRRKLSQANKPKTIRTK